MTKAQPLAALRAVYDLGLRHFGENRVGEAETRIADLPTDITWHMIGHIQSRKAARAVSVFKFIHSVDSLRLARRLDRSCTDRKEPIPILLELNVSGETTKFGFAADRWHEDSSQRSLLLRTIEEITSMTHVQVCGLMTVAPMVSDPEATRPVFAHLRRVRDDLAEALPQTHWQHLSMGMTDDFEVAIEEGATMVRVGRAIFDPGLPPWRGG